MTSETLTSSGQKFGSLVLARLISNLFGVGQYPRGGSNLALQRGFCAKRGLKPSFPDKPVAGRYLKSKPGLITTARIDKKGALENAFGLDRLAKIDCRSYFLKDLCDWLVRIRAVIHARKKSPLGGNAVNNQVIFRSVLYFALCLKVLWIHRPASPNDRLRSAPRRPSRMKPCAKAARCSERRNEHFPRNISHALSFQRSPILSSAITGELA